MTTAEYEARRAAWWDAKHAENIRRASGTARRQYAEQQEQARVANYRIAWSQDEGGYFAQWRDGDRGWITVGKAHRVYAEATLDAKLNAGQCGTECRLYPLIANLTVGRREYDVDLTKPFPGY